MTEENNVLQRYILELNTELKGFDSAAVEKMFVKLIDLEKSFAKKLLKTGQGKRVYSDFINMIYKLKRSMLYVRPYFRQRESMYLNTINKAVEKNQPTKLYDAPVNFKFIMFAVARLEENEREDAKKKAFKEQTQYVPVKFELNKDLAVIFEKIKSLRHEIMNNNLFLALSKAKGHARSHGGSFADMSDLVQIANEGLILAVDKYVPSEGSVFATMAIGRMVANLIENGSNQSPVTVNSSGRKKLYRIRRLLEKNPSITRGQIAEILKVSEQEVNDLIEATHYLSLDQPVGAEDDRTMGDVTPDTEMTDAYEMTENKDLFLKLLSAYEYLSVIEQKILKLKGVNLMKTLNKLVAVTIPQFKHDTEPTQTTGFVVSDKLSPTLVECKVVMDSDKYKADDVLYFKSDIRNNHVMNSRYRFEDKEFILVPEELVVAMK